LDYKHYWELLADYVQIDAQQHAETLKLFKREGLRAWSNAQEGATVRSTGLTTALEAEKQLMRLSGVLKQPHVLQQNDVFQQLTPELAGSHEYRAAVAEILRLLPARGQGSRHHVADTPEQRPVAGTIIPVSNGSNPWICHTTCHLTPSGFRIDERARPPRHSPGQCHHSGMVEGSSACARWWVGSRRRCTASSSSTATAGGRGWL